LRAAPPGGGGRSRARGARRTPRAGAAPPRRTPAPPAAVERQRMQPIDRRALVRAAAAAAAGALALPEVLNAFTRAQDPQPGGKQPSRAEQVAAAVARSKAEGKPLLVFVVPARQEDHGPRELRLGAFLNQGGSNALLEVALCVPVCASVDALKAWLGGEVAGEPLMLLVDLAAGRAPVVAAIDPKVEEPPQWRTNKLPHEEFVAA